MENALADQFRGTSLEEPLAALEEIYDLATARAVSWAKASRLACGSSCGACCERFVPDILPVEALYLAAWITRTKPELLACLEGFNGKYCPLYDHENPFHCTAYDARPLVCRLFGYSGSRDKKGGAIFSLCFAMSGEKRNFTEAETIAAFGSLPPFMTDSGTAVASVIPESAGKRSLLPFAVAEAASRVKMVISYANSRGA